jgi:pimeloyl-ACP methyl ester carboxylesterase
MSGPASHLLRGSPSLHFLEWNPRGRVTVIVLHGATANAWWWAPMARAISPELRLLALDQRGHGDSDWVRPSAYAPADYAGDLARFIEQVAPGAGDARPIVVGHSMGGIIALAFARNHPEHARAVAAIDVAITSSRPRDRFLRRLRALPTVTYPDLATARARYRLMPAEGAVAPEILHEIAERSLARTDEGRFTLKFDRESFFGSDGIHVLETIREIELPTLLVRAERSRIMTAEAAVAAARAGRRARLATIPAAHHHVLLEKPEALARVLTEFIESL